MRAFHVLAIGAVVVTACGPPPERFEYTEYHMGLETRIIAWGDSSTVGAMRAAFDRISALEDTFSAHRRDSELNAIRPGTQVLSHHLRNVLFLADRMHRASGGTLDPTVGLVTHPLRDTAFTARFSSHWEHLEFDWLQRTIRVPHEIVLDLNAVAKGYILDRAGDVLRAHGVHRFLIESGGEILVGSSPPDAPGWVIALPDGMPDTVANRAISTAGSMSPVNNGTTHRSHLIDPDSGLGLTTFGTATVTASSSAVADGIATALRIGGDARWADLRREFPSAQRR